MKVSVSTAGSRGDFEPYVALTQALISAGHEVTFAAPRDARRLVAGTDAKFIEMDLEVREVLRSEEGQQWLAAGNVEAYLGASRRCCRTPGTPSARRCWPRPTAPTSW
ncbi:hypothetical protein SAV14893_068690 [Streptomyces avermitilis]|uniref:Glycosyltransferase family 28 N-terminal domain-containing protein n=1 Tax=Streptomyces avermitilis TaxID=33903 RepID=A0A4D4M6D2_STRAX|nr:glycosyltransferase [Streptomyces avermitilis]GDY67476.1 hypothetical protein SAV14893_068690 [Streptomyces avermitilis]